MLDVGFRVRPNVASTFPSFSCESERFTGSVPSGNPAYRSCNSPLPLADAAGIEPGRFPIHSDLRLTMGNFLLRWPYQLLGRVNPW